MSKKLLFRLVVLLMTMMCALGASAAEAYACYTPSNTTLTFYCDNDRSTRPGTTYDLNTVNNDPGWYTDGTNVNVTKVVFDTSFADARPTTTFDWFYDMQDLESITGLSYLNTSEVTIMTDMFNSCHKLTSLDLSNFNTAKVTDMALMFANCRGLTSLDLSNFNTDNVTTMELMFASCWALTSLNLNGWNTAKVTNMTKMFYGCTSLTTIYVGTGWSTTSVTHSLYMFYFCTKLVGGMGTTYSDSHIDKAYAHIDGGPSNPGYFTEKKEAYACYTPSNTTLTFYYDSQRYSRTGTTYDLNADDNNPGWKSDGTNTSVTRVVFDPSFAAARPTTTYRWFNNMTGLTTISGLHYLNTSEVTNMQNMFSGSGLTSLDLSGFNTANVTDMSYMFYNCSNLRSLDVSSFNTSNVTDMRTMFYGCSNLSSLDVSSFNTSSATTLTYMFCGCSSLTSLDVSCFNTSSAKNLSYMFRDCSGLTSLDLGSFNTSRATNMSYMFDGCSGLNTIYAGDGWNTAAVTSSANMFWNCSNIRGGKGTTYDANHIDKAYAHIDGGPSNPGYFTEKPKEAYACYTSDNTTLTFYYDNQRSSRSGTTYDLNTGYDWPGWRDDGSNASVTRVVFDSSFAGARPTSTHLWFGDMVQLTTITGMKQYLNTSSVTHMSAMFYWCKAMTSFDLSGFNTAQVKYMDDMFMGCSNLRSLDLSGFNTAQVTNMLNMFSNCRSLTSLDLSNFNTAQVTRMISMFYDCSSLTSLDLSSFNTAKVTSMYSMFCGCSSLTSLDLSSFNPAQLVNTRYMFQDCSDLATIYAGSGWSTATVTYSGDMFLNCTSLVGGMGTTYNSSHVDATYAHIDGGPSNPGYFTDANAATEAYAVYTEDNTTLTFYYDNQRRTRPGTAYGLNLGSEGMEWHETSYSITEVVFDPSFADVRPTTTSQWFEGMYNLLSITGLEYLNTDSVTDMSSMFYGCRRLSSVDLSHFNTSNVTSMYFMFANCRTLTSLDLSSFNTGNVTTMECMFLYCTGLTSVDLSGFTNARVERTSNMFESCYALTTIYADSGWSLPANNYSYAMFNDCTNLVGGKGTTFDANHTDAEYARIDGGPSNPGYFTAKGGTGLRGDVNGDGNVNISDVTALIDYLLSGDASGINLAAAECNLDSGVSIGDVTALIDYLLSGTWN